MAAPASKRRKLSSDSSVREFVKGEMEDMQFEASVVEGVIQALEGYTAVALSEASVEDLVQVFKQTLPTQTVVMLTGVAQSLRRRIQHNQQLILGENITSISQLLQPKFCAFSCFVFVGFPGRLS